MAGAAIVGAVATVASTVVPLVTGDSDAGASAAGLASQGQQRGIDELSRRFDETQGNIQPFIDAGLGALPSVEEGSTIPGLDARLAEIFNTDIFGALSGERGRAVAARNAASGNFGSGAGFLDAARVPTDIGLAIEDLLQGRATGLASGGVNAASNLGQLSQNAGNSIASLLADQGVVQGQGNLFDSESRAARNNALFSGIGGAGQAASGIAGGTSVGSALGTIATGFSDSRLKENIQPIMKLKGLTVYRWDWLKELKDTIVSKVNTTGFMAQEVIEKYPEYVYDFGGFHTIDYKGLLSKLETV